MAFAQKRGFQVSVQAGDCGLPRQLFPIWKWLLMEDMADFQRQCNLARLA